MNQELKELYDKLTPEEIIKLMLYLQALTAGIAEPLPASPAGEGRKAG